MKKLFKIITIFFIGFFLLVNTSVAQASDDDEKPKYPKGTNIPMIIELLIH